MKDFLLVLGHDSMTHFKMDVWKLKLTIFALDEYNSNEIGYIDLTIVDTRTVDIEEHKHYIGIDCITYIDMLKRYPDVKKTKRLLTFMEKLYLQPEYRNKGVGAFILKMMLHFLERLPMSETIAFSAYPISNEEYDPTDWDLDSAEYKEMTKRLHTFYQRHMDVTYYELDNSKKDSFDHIFVYNVKPRVKHSGLFDHIKEFNFSDEILAILYLDEFKRFKIIEDVDTLRG